MISKQVILIRHGESIWNQENKFTGWTDIDLSQKGIEEAKYAGKLLKHFKYSCNYAYTSVLKRAIHTLWYIMDELNLTWLPIIKTWELNERHYGALQGLNKDEVLQKYGKKQFDQWRRGFINKPPAIDKNDSRYPGKDPRYTDIPEKLLPTSESLEMTLNRVKNFWNNNIILHLKENITTTIIIVSHGNTIRSIITFLDNLSENKISELNIPTGSPIIYEFNKFIQPINNFYLKDKIINPIV